MSPLMPAVRLAEAATLPLPHSQEMRAPASAMLPCCFSSKMVWMTRTKSCGARPPVSAARSSSSRFGYRGVERRVRVILPGRDEGLFHPADPAVEDVAQGAARADAVPSSVITLRYTSSKRWNFRSLSETTTKLVANPCACASSTARRAMNVLPQP